MVKGPRWVRSIGREAVRAFGWMTADFRAVPDFLLIGAKRCGTTSLFRYLLDHPQVAPLFPSARFLPLAEDTKGVHWFDRHGRRSFRWYRSHFRTRSSLRRAGCITGEASPYYLFRPGCAERAAGVLPGAKLVVVLREPVARAWSHWKEQRRNGVEWLDFADAVAAEPDRTAGVEERLAADAGLRVVEHEHLSYVRQGEYVRGLEPWLDRYPRSSLHVVWSEDLFTRPAPTFGAVCDFLGIDGVRRESWEVWNAAEAAPPDVEVAAALAAHYDPLDRALGDALDLEPPWLADRTRAP